MNISHFHIEIKYNCSAGFKSTTNCHFSSAELGMSDFDRFPKVYDLQQIPVIKMGAEPERIPDMSAFLPQTSKRSSDESLKSSKRKKQKKQTDKTTSRDKDTHRQVSRYPRSLLDPMSTGVLDFKDQGDPVQIQAIIQAAQTKLAAVKAGTMEFGARVLIRSFKPYEPKNFRMAATLPNTFFMNILCTDNVAYTQHGKVSVFPVTVHTSKDSLDKKLDGFPGLAVHVAHFKTLSWMVYSRCRITPISNETLMGHVTYRCEFNADEDEPLIALSGFEMYKTPKQKQEGGFIIIPAHFIDVMKYLFVKPPFYVLRDIADVWRNVYATSHPNFVEKLIPENRAIWLGVERDVLVSYMITTPEKKHNYSMARVRALNGQVRLGTSGLAWKLPPATTFVEYHNLSFAYGVQCWAEQVHLFNTAYTFFTGVKLEKLTHQAGLFALDHAAGGVLGRAECIARGIHKDHHTARIPSEIRRNRDHAKRQFGDNGAYFGPENVVRYQRRHLKKKSAAADDDSEPEFDPEQDVLEEKC